MALNSINTNIASYSAQGNIGRASDSASSSVARLSSGNRIVRAADDVAALSVGTSLRTTVSTLKVALTNASQATSLLQVADGGLGQIAEILQRQKAISVQANSGTLSATERSYLNQEFQSLRAQIDQIAGSSSFSAVKLLDGSLAGSVNVNTNAAESAQTTSGSTAGNILALTANAVDGDQITINGVAINFTGEARGTAAAAGKVVIGTTATETMSNLVEFLNSSSDARLANFYFSNGPAATPTANLTANWAGGEMAGAVEISAGVTLGTAANYGVGVTADRTIAVTNPVNGLGIDRVRALGSISGSLLLNGSGVATMAGSALYTNLIEDNAAFLGKIGQGSMGFITGNFTSAGNATFSIKVGDITYSTDVVDFATDTELTFVGYDQYNVAKGGEFSLNLRPGAVAAADISGQAGVNDIVAQLNSGLSGITFTQNRDVTTFQDGQVVTVGGAEVGRLDGFSVDLRSSNFSNIIVESVKILAPTQGSTDARFEVVINGETFVSASGIGNQIRTNTTIGLQSLTDPTKALTFVTGATTIASSTTVGLDLGTQANADAVAKALEDALGFANAGSKLNFQVGVSSADTIGVRIGSVKADSLYGGQNLDISTQSGAQNAANVIDAALVQVTKVRADVGALQSRLGFTSANLQTSVQNQDAARGVLLDTDVAAESTAYATAQVQLQAGISVLAQANLFTQNLLKLIG